MSCLDLHLGTKRRLSANGRPAAYVVYFFSFATTVGRRGLWLDDIFVEPEYRGKGVAKALMAYLADRAIKNHSSRFEWVVLAWNRPALDLYERIGSTVLDDWRICRLDSENLIGVAEKA